mmetsp:Transcript_12506/g.17059  ORF Transcript_12506/g.17059 Transcript_12506/m.17059 type:complete len:208 (-) Transcript_12506:2816-3439(-)
MLEEVAQVGVQDAELRQHGGSRLVSLFAPELQHAEHVTSEFFLNASIGFLQAAQVFFPWSGQPAHPGLAPAPAHALRLILDAPLGVLQHQLDVSHHAHHQADHKQDHHALRLREPSGVEGQCYFEQLLQGLEHAGRRLGELVEENPCRSTHVLPGGRRNHLRNCLVVNFLPGGGLEQRAGENGLHALRIERMHSRLVGKVVEQKGYP